MVVHVINTCEARRLLRRFDSRLTFKHSYSLIKCSLEYDKSFTVINITVFSRS